jgi:hypothetical protein
MNPARMAARLSPHGIIPIDVIALKESTLVNSHAGSLSYFTTLFRYPNEEEVDFPEAADLESAREFCVVAKQMVTERIAVF